MSTATENIGRAPGLLAGLPAASLAAAAVGAALLAGGALALDQAYDWRRAAQLALGAALGLTLYHAAFGFTAAWRRFIVERRGDGLRAQMLMLAIAVALFFPVLAEGTLFGRQVGGFVNPASTAVMIGAFVFGIGMQLGGACASGTLFTAGGGNARMVVTLAFFIVGSVVATAHLPWWRTLPSLGPVSLLRAAGWPAALAANLAVFAAIAIVTRWLEKRRHGSVARPPQPARRGLGRLLQGPWPLLLGAVLLALLNFATLALTGRPWGITSAFALWGAQLFDAVGIPVRDWPYWANQAGRIDAGPFADTTSVMNFGIIVGAFMAAGLAGRFAPSLRIPARSLAAAVLGGLMLGYGARLAYGCNIGAYFSGLASGSLHGWVWLVAAFAGNAVGVRLRPWFRL
ncbi:MAG: YeeE/YedE family protein [Alphaproteobacteria bacterium]